MDLRETLASGAVVMTGGSIVERLRRDPDVVLHPDLLNAAFVQDPARRPMLAAVYREYLDISARHELPTIVCTPTWRANEERCRRAGTKCDALNRDAAAFLREIRDGYSPYADRIFVGGLMGCRGDAYDPSESLGPDQAAAFHSVQARALAAGGVDFLVAVTLPAAPEALGMAAALSDTGLPYFLSFMIRPSGRLLDGTALHDAIRVIDEAATPRPLAYWVNCVHPTVLHTALDTESRLPNWPVGRLIGLQANTSTLSPEELDGCDVLQTEAPEAFVEAMLAVARAHDLRILGGCCGTAPEHIDLLAARLAAPQN